MSSELLKDVDPEAVKVVETKYGMVAASEYGYMYASRKNAVDKLIARLEGAEDASFVLYASWAITESARMNSFSGNYEDLHVVATVAYEISNQRADAKGVGRSCPMHGLYKRAWIRAYTEQGHHYDRSDDSCRCHESEE